MNTILAPIILFVYNRPKHTENTLKALKKNTLAKDSILYIYCDGVSDKASEELKSNNDLVKKIIKQQRWCKEVFIIESTTNKGLANSVISGVTEIVNKYGKVIVLEDDLITASTFLEFMNEALERYEKESKVIQISGYSFPAPKIESSNSSYFLTLTSTWGWATWKRAWETIDFECSDYITLKGNKKLTYQFNYNGSYNYKKMFLQQMESNKISSWGIRFYWNAFKNNSLILFPDKSLVFNNGWDNSGKHKDSYDIFPMLEWQSDYKIENFPIEIKTNQGTNTLIGRYLKSRTSFAIKVYYKLKLFFFSK